MPTVPLRTLLPNLKKAAPADRFSKEGCNALIACSSTLVLAGYGPGMNLQFFLFNPRGTSLGTPEKLELKGYEMGRTDLSVVGDFVFAQARDAQTRSVLIVLDVKNEQLNVHPVPELGSWGRTRSVGDLLLHAEKQGARTLTLWKMTPHGLVREGQFDLPFEGWFSFGVMPGFVGFVGPDHTPTRIFKFDGRRIMPHCEIRGKFAQQNRILLQKDGIIVLFGSHRKVCVTRWSDLSNKTSTMGTVGVSNSYNRAIRVNNSVLLCDADIITAPPATAFHQLDIVEWGSEGLSRMKFASPIPRVLDLVPANNMLNFLTPEGVFSYAVDWKQSQ